MPDFCWEKRCATVPTRSGRFTLSHPWGDAAERPPHPGAGLGSLVNLGRFQINSAENRDFRIRAKVSRFHNLASPSTGSGLQLLDRDFVPSDAGSKVNLISVISRIIQFCFWFRSTRT